MDSDNFTINFHTHTERCRHATGQIKDYCRFALDNGIQILGISDHSPFPNKEEQGSRMDFSELPAYSEELTAAEKQFPELTILRGMEIDYFDWYGIDFYKTEFIEKLKLDYLLGGLHFVTNGKNEIIWRPSRPMDEKTLISLYIKQAITLMETGLIDYLCHPDIVGRSIANWTSYVESAFMELINVAEKLDIPLEINANGPRKPKIQTSEGLRTVYPWQQFWKLVADSERNIKIVIGADAHSPQELTDHISDCYDILNCFGFSLYNEELAKKIRARKNSKK